MHNTVSYTVPLFSFRNLSSPGRHSFIWSIDFTNSWEIQVREMSSLFVWVIYKWENVNVAPVTCRLVFSYAVPSRKTPGSMLTVFACKYCDHIADGRTAVIDMALSSNSTFSATRSLCAAAETPWHIHALSWLSLAPGQQLSLWIGLRLQADLPSWGLNRQLLLDASLEPNLLYRYRA